MKSHVQKMTNLVHKTLFILFWIIVYFTLSYYLFSNCVVHFPEILRDNDTSTEPTSLKQARSLYRSCMDTGETNVLACHTPYCVYKHLLVLRLHCEFLNCARHAILYSQLILSKIYLRVNRFTWIINDNSNGTVLFELYYYLPSVCNNLQIVAPK